MAPELMTQIPIEYGIEVDIYSFGIILNQLLSKRKPYEELAVQSLNDFFTLVKEGRRPFKATTEQKLSILIDKCWHKTASHRPIWDSIYEDLSNISPTFTNKK